MIKSNRRTFLGGLSTSMLALGAGASLGRGAFALPATFGGDDMGTLSFGALEPLATLMQETPPRKLQRILIEKLRDGTSLRTLIAAGALANARTPRSGLVWIAAATVGFRSASSVERSAIQIRRSAPFGSRARASAAARRSLIGREASITAASQAAVGAGASASSLMVRFET